MGKRRADKMMQELMAHISEQQSVVKDSSVANYLRFVNESLHFIRLEQARKSYLARSDVKIRDGI